MCLLIFRGLAGIPYGPIWDWTAYVSAVDYRHILLGGKQNQNLQTLGSKEMWQLGPTHVAPGAPQSAHALGDEPRLRASHGMPRCGRGWTTTKGSPIPQSQSGSPQDPGRPQRQCGRPGTGSLHLYISDVMSVTDLGSRVCRRRGRPDRGGLCAAVHSTTPGAEARLPGPGAARTPHAHPVWCISSTGDAVSPLVLWSCSSWRAGIARRVQPTPLAATFQGHRAGALPWHRCGHAVTRVLNGPSGAAALRVWQAGLAHWTTMQ